MPDHRIKCPACEAINYFPRFKCTECKGFLREKVPNINLWEIFRQIMESPGEAVVRIIYSEKKNYVLILSMIVFLKSYFVFNNTVTVTGVKVTGIFGELFNIFIFAIYYILILLLISIILVIMSRKKRLPIKIKGLYSVLVYAHTPLILSFIFITSLEFALFGSHWFFGNPDPFIIKPSLAYLLYAMESILYIWFFIIIFIAVKTVSSNIIQAVIFSLITVFLLNLHLVVLF